MVGHPFTPPDAATHVFLPDYILAHKGRGVQSSTQSRRATSLGQKIEAEKNGDTVFIRGSPVGRGDYDL